jgi:uncharacterized membrane protein YhaH (DUF805 family)
MTPLDTTVSRGLALAPGAEPMTPLQIFFSFRGRIPRRTWWLYGVVAIIGLGVLGTVLLRVIGVSATTAENTVNLVLLWPALAVSAKRWHDRNKAGWWLLINLIPVVGSIWSLVENGFLRGTRGDNRFGADLTDAF